MPPLGIFTRATHIPSAKSTKAGNWIYIIARQTFRIHVDYLCKYFPHPKFFYLITAKKTAKLFNAEWMRKNMKRIRVSRNRMPNKSERRPGHGVMVLPILWPSLSSI